MRVSRFFAIVCFSCVLAAGSALAQHSESAETSNEVHLSPELLSLLRSEMREISTGMQAISLSLATADWQVVHETGKKIQNSYLLKQSLTEAQLEELKNVLPEQFKQLDGEFHQRAGKLAEAAKRKNPEAIAFQYSRMLENCTDCHSMYAQERFPGFSTEQPKHDH